MEKDGKLEKMTLKRQTNMYCIYCNSTAEKYNQVYCCVCGGATKWSIPWKSIQEENL